MNIKRVAVVGLGVLLWAAQAMASQWDDQITQWKKESTTLKAEQIPQLEEAAKNGDVRATYLLFREISESRYTYAQRSSANQLGLWAQRIADAGNPIGMTMLCKLFEHGLGGVVKNETLAFQWCQKGAVPQFGRAIGIFAYMYRDGIGVNKDANEALKWFRKGAELFDDYSITALGTMYKNGTGVTKDITEALKWFRQGASSNYIDSIRNLGVMYRDGVGVTKDGVEALKWFRKGAELNDTFSIASLGAMYRDGTVVTKDAAEAIRWYRLGAELNDSWSISSLGEAYRDGNGVPKDVVEAVKLFRKGADLKDTSSIASLGAMYRDGAGVTKNTTEAVKWFRKGAELNNAYSMSSLGDMYRDGTGVTKDGVEAVKWYRKGAELNHGTSIASLGAMYRDGAGVTKDTTEAVKWFRKGAELNNAYSMSSLGDMYRDGTGVTKDGVEAVKWFRKGAELNDGTSIASLGVMYRDGVGVTKDAAEGLKWFRKGAELNHGVSVSNLGYMYRDGVGVTKDTTEAVRWFRKGAELNNGTSIASLGVMYLDGAGVTKDAAEALKWFRKGAELNDAYSMSRLGDMYRDGKGVTKDGVEAVKWYRKGADLNHGFSMVGLGHMYLYQNDIAQDFAEALKWFRKAAELGVNPYANTAIGELYHNGHGVVFDEAEASKWFRRAADGGDAAGMVQLARNYKLGRGVTRNTNESARLYVKALNATNNASFNDTGETGQQKARRELDAMLAAGEITDPEVLREVRALSKPAPKAEWVQAPQTTSEEEVTFKFNVVDGGGGIGDVSFKLNGVALNVAQGRNASVIELANNNIRTFTFRLPPGKHDVEVIAYNAENLINWTSLKSTVTSTFKPIRKPQLHAVIVGINDYENDKLKLRFATNDATEVAKVLKASGEKLYDQVHVKLLNTRGSTGKTAILQAIKEAASKAQTEDVFIFYVAGHGQNFGDNGYHMLTADVGVMTDKAIQERSISAQELQLAISNVPSGKKVVLLDTCQSGGGLDASKLMSVRGGIDNLDMVKDMNRKSGAIVLAAAESKEDAMEGYQGHGVFTFALLEALKGKADTKGDGIVSTFQLQEYVSDRTYQLAQQAFNGKKQSPYTSGSNGFPFLKWK